MTKIIIQPIDLNNHYKWIVVEHLDIDIFNVGPSFSKYKENST